MSDPYYVVEAGNSDPYNPDFLLVDGAVIKWLEGTLRTAREVFRKPADTRKIATHFASAEEASAKVAYLFGDSFPHRITQHQD